MSSYSDTIYWGNTRVTYAYEFAQRKTLSISVHPDLLVTVKAPTDTPLEVIREKVKKRARWITQARREFELYLPKQPPREYVSGEAHRYLGRQYRLKIVQGDEETVKCLRGYLTVFQKEITNGTKTRALVDGWYKERAKAVFNDCLEKSLKRFYRYKMGEVGFSIRKMTTRWGSCSRSGRITLNIELIKAPKDCIEYVITHEICHLLEPHHGPKFWRLLSKVMPSYEKKRARLNLHADV